MLTNVTPACTPAKKAWLVEKYIWEVKPHWYKKEFKMEKKEKTPRSILSAPTEEEAKKYGLVEESRVLCLAWERGGKGKRLDEKIITDLESAARRVLEGDMDYLVAFTRQFGPPVTKGSSFIPVAEVKNILAFYLLISDIFRAVVETKREADIRKYLTAEKYHLEGFVELFDSFFGLEREFYRLYLDGGKPILTSDAGKERFDEDSWYLKLPAPLPQERLIPYAREALIENLNRFLRGTKLSSRVDFKDGRLVTAVLTQDVLTGAFFFMLHRAEKETFGKCKQCGREFYYRGHGRKKEFCSRACFHKHQRREETDGKKKDALLAVYRSRENRGGITKEAYEEIKTYVNKKWGKTTPEKIRKAVERKFFPKKKGKC